MPSDLAGSCLLSDEHYPGWFVDDLVADGLEAVALTRDRPELRGADDSTVLLAAVAEGRIVVTEDVSTFSQAVAHVPEHIGIIYCHPARFPRTRAGLGALRTALVAVATDLPSGLGEHPIEWWLPRSSGERERR